jgi:23S rRNA A1618 N6-methylase RlmF
MSIKNNNQIKVKINLKERNEKFLKDLNQLYDNNNECNIIQNLNKNSKLEISKKNYECSICLQIIKQNEIMRTTICNHHFHSNCLDRWFEEKPNCPLCNKNIINPQFLK